MNILIISHVFPPKKGGVQTAAYNTAKFLSEKGHNIVVLTSKWDHEQRSFHKMDKFLIYRFKSFHPPELSKIPQISSLRIMPMALFYLPKIITKHKIQIIHIQGRLFPISFMTVILNLIVLKKPILLTVQGRLQVGVTGNIENIFDKIITKKIYQKLDKIICVSKSLKNRLLRFNIDTKKIQVIPNGVDIIKFKVIVKSNYLDKYIKGKEYYKRVVFVGRLDMQKGVEYLIKAIPMVLKQYSKVHFFILGNGNLENYIKNLSSKLKINDNITFLDFIPLDKMPNFYADADIFCLPSIHEGFPLSIAEALSMGLIIIASNIEGIPEAIKENENGFLVESRNIRELKDKLIKALNLSDSQIQKIKNNNINLAQLKYSWITIIKELENIYRNCIKNKLLSF